MSKLPRQSPTPTPTSTDPGPDPEVPTEAAPAEGLGGPPVDAGSDSPGEELGGGRQRGVRAALASLPTPDAQPVFWDKIENALDDQDQLEILTRPAVRSITEPPPLSQPRLDDDPARAMAALYQPAPGARRRDLDRSFDHNDGDRRRRLLGIAAVVIVLAVLVGASVLGEDQGDVTSAPPTTVAGEGASVPSTAPQVPGLEAAMPLTAYGLGPLQAGLTLQALQESGATTTLDQPTFDGSGGTCFDVRLPGAADVTLRFRSPDPRVGVTDPRQGVLVSVNLDAAIGSARVTDTGIGLGATEEQVRAAHQGSLQVSDHPYISGGRVYLARDRDRRDIGIAYVTDGHQVIEMNAGLVDVIRLRNACV